MTTAVRAATRRRSPSATWPRRSAPAPRDHRRRRSLSRAPAPSSIRRQPGQPLSTTGMALARRPSVEPGQDVRPLPSLRRQRHLHGHREGHRRGRGCRQRHGVGDGEQRGPDGRRRPRRDDRRGRRPSSSSGSFTDPGADTWTATVDYGDGSGVQALTLTDKTFNLSHTYADNGSYTVTVTCRRRGRLVRAATRRGHRQQRRPDRLCRRRRHRARAAPSPQLGLVHRSWRRHLDGDRRLRRRHGFDSLAVYAQTSPLATSTSRTASTRSPSP